MKKLLAAVLFSATIATPALAQQTPFYVGAVGGDEFVGVLGGYQIDKMFSVEAHYSKLRLPDYSLFGTRYDVDGSNMGVNLVVMLPWQIKQVPKLTFFAKGGIERTKVKTSVSDWWGYSSVSATSTDLVAGGGADYEVTKNFHARVGKQLVGERNDFFVAAIYKF